MLGKGQRQLSGVESWVPDSAETQAWGTLTLSLPGSPWHVMLGTCGPGKGDCPRPQPTAQLRTGAIWKGSPGHLEGDWQVLASHKVQDTRALRKGANVPSGGEEPIPRGWRILGTQSPCRSSWKGWRQGPQTCAPGGHRARLFRAQSRLPGQAAASGKEAEEEQGLGGLDSAPAQKWCRLGQPAPTAELAKPGSGHCSGQALPPPRQRSEPGRQTVLTLIGTPSPHPLPRGHCPGSGQLSARKCSLSS